MDDPVTALVQLLTKASLDHGLLGLMIGSRLSWRAREELASLLLKSGCWEFQRPTFETVAAAVRGLGRVARLI